MADPLCLIALISFPKKSSLSKQGRGNKKTKREQRERKNKQPIHSETIEPTKSLDTSNQGSSH